MKGIFAKTPRIILAFLIVTTLSGAFSVVGSMQSQQKKKATKTETYTRPKPSTPIKPEIPSVNRYQEDKVFLENADSLYRPGNEMEEKQIVKGNVKFRQGGMWMFCDSAYYFPEQNSMDAFGHVVMQQGDTLFVYSDKLFYNGAEKHAILTSGPSQREVMLKDRKVTLTTDSLDYDLVMELGWYTEGGKLRDETNTLTSVYGQYSPSAKIAEFRDNVILNNTKDGYKMSTEELIYNTATGMADINTTTRIEGANDTILTAKGTYDTRNDHAELLSRSTLVHKDSANNVVTLEGDSIIYDKLSRISEAYMFKDINKNGRPMVLTDTARKMTLIGGYGMYNDSLQSSLAADYPLLMEYSRPDTLFLRSDTILTYMRTEKVWPDSLSHEWDAATRARLKAFTSIGQIADSMIMSLSGLPYGFPRPGQHPALKEIASMPFWEKVKIIAPKSRDKSEHPGKEENNQERLELVEADDITVETNDGETEETEKSEETERSGLTPEKAEAPKDSVLDSVPKLLLPRLDRLGRDSNYMVDKQFHAAKAIGKARFFNQQLQGIADTIIYQQYDSLLHLIRKPIVWSEERQVTGEKIIVQFNDSTPEWAHLPSGGFVAEHIDEDFYNQLSGSELKAYFENSEMKHLDVNGNVETIFLPMESDSTYTRLVHAESSYLTVDMNGKQMEHLKMWPEVDGTVTPIFLVKQVDKSLPGFRWLELLRPKREWYGDRIKWADELGEVPDVLIQYFNEPEKKRK